MALSPEEMELLQSLRQREQQPAEAPEAPSTGVSDYARSGLQGLSAGFGDEAIAAIVAAVARLTGEAPSYAEAYKTVRDMEREKQSQFAEANPKTDLGLQIAGTVGSAALAPLAAPARAVQAAQAASPVARTLGLGAAAGALEGAGRSEADTAGGLAADTGVGAALGAAAGPATAIASRGAAALGSQLAPLFRGSRTTAQRGVDAALEAESATPGDVLRGVAELGEGAVPADVDALTQVGRAYAPREAAQELLETRVKEQAGRVEKVLQAKAPMADVPLGYKGTVKSWEAARRKEAKKLYDEAYKAPLPEGSFPELVNLLEHPSIGPALKAAYREGAEITPDLKVQPRQMIDGITKSEDPADWTWKRLPTWREYDIIQRGLRRQAERAGRSDSNSLKRHIMEEVRKPLLDRLDAANPAFAAARRAYAGKSEVLDAAERGAKLLNSSVDPEDLAYDIVNMSPSELQALRLGMVKNIRKVIENTRDRNDLAVKLGSDPAQRAKMAMVLGEEGTEALLGELERTSRLISSARTMAGGSDTARQQAMQEVVQGATDTGMLGEFARGNISAGLTGGVRKALERPGKDPLVRAEIGNAMMDPAVFERLMQENLMRNLMPGGGRGQAPSLFPSLLGGRAGGVAAGLFQDPQR